MSDFAVLPIAQQVRPAELVLTLINMKRVCVFIDKINIYLSTDYFVCCAFEKISIFVLILLRPYKEKRVCFKSQDEISVHCAVILQAGVFLV
jgi:hypothetical protein